MKSFGHGQRAEYPYQTQKRCLVKSMFHLSSYGALTMSGIDDELGEFESETNHPKFFADLVGEDVEEGMGMSLALVIERRD
jgi:hypothetical protein